MARHHPNKHISGVIVEALARGWTFRKAGPRAHIFGTLLCPHSGRDGHHVRVFSTPRSPEHHARLIMQQLARCQHRK